MFCSPPSALKILVETHDDYTLVLQLNGLPVLHEVGGRSLVHHFTKLSLFVDSGVGTGCHCLYCSVVLPQAFNTLHRMHHEATACHVAGDIVDLLSLMLGVVKTARQCIAEKKGLLAVRGYLLGFSTCCRNHFENPFSYYMRSLVTFEILGHFLASFGRRYCLSVISSG